MRSPLLSCLPKLVAFVSYRLGATDGVSVEAAKWAEAFERLGAEVRTVAGEGTADVVLPGLSAAGWGVTAGAGASGLDRELGEALEGADLVVADNICSLPLNVPAGEAVARALRGRPAVLRHHDLPWQRRAFREAPPPPDDPSWRHVTINERSRLELAARGIAATTIYNRFDPDPPAGDRAGARRAAGLGDDELVLLQPTRAIPRKNVPGGVLLAAALGATYWLLGPAEDGYGPELDRVLSRAPGRVVLGRPAGLGIEDAYAACDAVVLPSTWEGFGNPALESAVRRRPLALAPYPVSFELRRFGFSWFDSGDPEPLRRFLELPDEAVLDRNQYVARLRFSTDDLPEVLCALLTGEDPLLTEG